MYVQILFTVLELLEVIMLMKSMNFVGPYYKRKREQENRKTHRFHPIKSQHRTRQIPVTSNHHMITKLLMLQRKLRTPEEIITLYFKPQPPQRLESSDLCTRIFTRAWMGREEHEGPRTRRHDL